MDEKDLIRQFIMGNALIQASLGAHYLNGSDGGHPGEKDGYKKQNVGLAERGEYDKIAIHTATWSNKSCQGRCNKVGGYLFQPASDELERLKKYCEENLASGANPQSWEPFENNLYPRRYKPNKGETIYLGEDCRNKRHFDCISFVNWVLGTTLHKSFSYSIVQYEGKQGGGGVLAPVKTFKPPFPALQNADILTRINWDDDDEGNAEIGSKHIGFYMTGGKVVHASGAKVGVIISDYKPTDWTGMSRIKDTYLKFGD